MGQVFSLQPSDEGARYESAHGPAVLPADQAAFAMRLRLGDGEATPAWGMRSQDRAALERGVRVPSPRGRTTCSCADRLAPVPRAQDRPHSGALAGGRRGPAAIAPRRRGKVAVQRPGGEEFAWFKPLSLSREVQEVATSEDVALMLLRLRSNAAAALERRVPLPFSPSALGVVVP